MSKEGFIIQQIQPDTKMRKAAGQSVQDTIFDTKSKTQKVLMPSDNQTQPDVITDFDFNEKQEKAFQEATYIVNELIDGGTFDENLSVLENLYPLTYDHSVKVGIISAHLASFFELPSDEVLRAGAAGVNHDIGKTLHTEVVWDSFNWTDEEIEKNADAVKVHSEDSAALISKIDKNLMTPVVLHHAFQKNPYPPLKDFLDDMSDDEFRIVRYIALADQTEAVHTRSRENGHAKTDEEMREYLRSHEYVNREGVPVRAFTEIEIKVSLGAYQLLAKEAYPKAA